MPRTDLIADIIAPLPKAVKPRLDKGVTDAAKDKPDFAAHISDNASSAPANDAAALRDDSTDTQALPADKATGAKAKPQDASSTNDAIADENKAQDTQKAADTAGEPALSIPFNLASLQEAAVPVAAEEAPTDKDGVDNIDALQATDAAAVAIDPTLQTQQALPAFALAVAAQAAAATVIAPAVAANAPPATAESGTADISMNGTQSTGPKPQTASQPQTAIQPLPALPAQNLGTLDKVETPVADAGNTETKTDAIPVAQTDKSGIDDKAIKKVANADAQPEQASDNTKPDAAVAKTDATPVKSDAAPQQAMPDIKADAAPAAQLTSQNTVQQVSPPQALNPQNLAAPAPVQAEQAALHAPMSLERVPFEITASAHRGEKEFSIRLDPPELGRVDISVSVDKHGKVATHLVVERSETLDQLRRDAPNLERAFQNSGLKTDSGSLQFSLRDQSAQNFAQNQQNSFSRRGVVEIDLSQLNGWAQPQLASLGSGRGSGIDLRI